MYTYQKYASMGVAEKHSEAIIPSAEEMRIKIETSSSMLEMLVTGHMIKLASKMGLPGGIYKKNLFQTDIPFQKNWRLRFEFMIFWHIHNNMSSIVKNLKDSFIKANDMTEYRNVVSEHSELEMLEDITKWILEFKSEDELSVLNKSLLLFQLTSNILEQSYRERCEVYEKITNEIKAIDTISLKGDPDKFILITSRLILMVCFGFRVPFHNEWYGSIRYDNNYYRIKEVIRSLTKDMNYGLEENKGLYHPMFYAYLRAKNIIQFNKFSERFYSENPEYALYVYGLDFLNDIFLQENSSLKRLRGLFHGKMFRSIKLEQ